MKYAKAGMCIFLVDIVETALSAAVDKVRAVEGVNEVMGMKVDVGNVDEVIAMREKVLDVFGEVRISPSLPQSRPCFGLSGSDSLGWGDRFIS